MINCYVRALRSSTVT